MSTEPNEPPRPLCCPCCYLGFATPALYRKHLEAMRDLITKALAEAAK